MGTTESQLGRSVDRTCAILLMLGAVGHTLGAFKTYGSQPMVLIWSLSASVLIVLLGAINLLRVNRPRDATLAWICVVGTACWLAMVISFGKVLGNFLDFRVVIFAVVSLVLIGFGLRTATLKA